MDITSTNEAILAEIQALERLRGVLQAVGAWNVDGCIDAAIETAAALDLSIEFVVSVVAETARAGRLHVDEFGKLELLRVQ